MKRKIIALTAAILTLAGTAVVGGCSTSLKDIESNVSNTISNVTSQLQNNVVTSAWSQVNDAQLRADASKLDAVLRDFYSGVVAGTINEDSAGYLVTATLPAPTDSIAARKSCANSLTVLSAVEQQGMQNLFTEEYLTNFLYGGGKVVAKGEGNAAEFRPITLSTPLGDLVNQS